MRVRGMAVVVVLGLAACGQGGEEILPVASASEARLVGTLDPVLGELWLAEPTGLATVAGDGWSAPFIDGIATVPVQLEPEDHVFFQQGDEIVELVIEAPGWTEALEEGEAATSFGICTWAEID